MREPTKWDKITAVAQILTAIGTVTAVAFASVTSWAAVQAIEVSRSQASEAVQHDLTDRFTAAVGDLGADAEEVRIGGIYALERIAHDSQQDQPVVIEILCAYARKNASRPAPIAANATRSSPGRIATSTPASLRPKTDVEAAVTVVARRELRHQLDLIDLSHVDLTGVDLGYDSNYPSATKLRAPAQLTSVNFEDADLTGANLNSANLNRSNLVNASLVNANLHGLFDHSDLTKADLTGAHMETALLTNAILSDAILINSMLSGANLTKAIMIKAHLHGAVLGGATLVESSLIDADLTGAYLAGANLTGAYLAGANLTGAYLAGAHLTRVDLGGADLGGADLTRADLSGADLAGARNVTLKQLQDARTDHATTMPPGFRWTEHGAEDVNAPR
jgi:uncharacterized protein YjbI with pentapeptide repeats